MTISIRRNGDSLIEYNQFKVFGREVISGYGITFSLQGSRRGFDNPIIISNIRLSLSLKDPSIPIISNVAATDLIVKCSAYPSSNESLHFETILTKDQINALEEYRQDNDLKLSVGLRSLISCSENIESNYEMENFTIPREQWLTALSNSKFRQTILFELPLPSGTNELDKLYSKAQEFIETGHYKDAVMQCRHIIEHVELLREDRNLSSEANKMVQDRQRRKEMTAIERMLSLREQIKNVCQLGAHGSEDFSRSQARAVLGMTMALLVEPTVGFSISMNKSAL